MGWRGRWLVWFVCALLLGGENVSAQSFPAAASVAPECGRALLQRDAIQVYKDCERLERHIQWVEKRLQSVCRDAGERILRTVDNVEGVYVNPPSRDPNVSFGRYHEDDRLGSSWMSPTLGKHYSLWEMDMFGKPGMIEQKRYLIVPQVKGLARIDEPGTILAKPSARFGVTWRTFGEPADRARGLHGDETSVYDVASGEVIGMRRFYYALLDSSATDEAGVALRIPGRPRYVQEDTTRYCPGYRPKASVAYVDGRPRDSYEFVARVLRPAPISDGQAVGVFDLARGSGEKEGGCFVASFGPRIGPGDLNVVRVDDHGIRVSIRGTADALKCPTFFAPGYHASSARYRFYDGSTWNAAEIQRRASLAPRTLTPVVPAAAASAEAGGKADLRFNRLARAPTARDLVPECADAPAQSPAGLDCERLDRHVRWQEAKLATLCVDAGERIARTVASVDGLLVKPPPAGTADSTFHSSDVSAGAYLAPFDGRYYALYERDAPRAGERKVEQYVRQLTAQGRSRPLMAVSHNLVDRPTVRYGVTWRSILDATERRAGLEGEDTTVYEIASGEVLATRRLYYYFVRPGIVDESAQPLQSAHWRQSTLPNFVQTCRNVRLREDGRYTDPRPTDSYDFVSRVLKPAPIAADAAIGIFALVRGKGQHHASCSFARFGPGIGPGDVEVHYVPQNTIKIAIKGTNDAMWCGNFYADGMRAIAHRAELMFYDGTRWGFEDLDKRAGLRARALNK